MNEYICVQVDNHKDVGKTIAKWQTNGWRLHTYQATGRDIWIKHYLLFEKGEWKHIFYPYSIESTNFYPNWTTFSARDYINTIRDLMFGPILIDPI